MLQRIWEYNPLTRTGGDGLIPTSWIPYNNTTWTINSFSSQEAGGEGPVSGYAKAIIDGNATTYWHSRWSSNAATPPHWIVVDMGAVQPVDGFVFTQRAAGSRNIKNMKVEVSTDNVSWTVVKGSPFALTQTAPAQQKNLTEVLNCRYIRLTVSSTADVFDGTQFAALAEFTALHP